MPAFRGSKYKAKKTVYEGRSYASGGEAECMAFLRLLEKAGKLSNIKQQDTVYMTKSRVSLRVDFRVFDEELKETVWIEFKGFETSDWLIKKKLWPNYGPGLLRIYKKFGSRMCLHEQIRSTFVEEKEEG